MIIKAESWNNWIKHEECKIYYVFGLFFYKKTSEIFIEAGQVNIVREKKREGCESESRELWRERSFIVVEPKCDKFMWRVFTLNQGLEAVIGWVNTNVILGLLPSIALPCVRWNF